MYVLNIFLFSFSCASLAADTFPPYFTKPYRRRLRIETDRRMLRSDSFSHTELLFYVWLQSNSTDHREDWLLKEAGLTTIITPSLVCKIYWNINREQNRTKAREADGKPKEKLTFISSMIKWKSYPREKRTDLFYTQWQRWQ